jgi:hypothetical protein
MQSNTLNQLTDFKSLPGVVLFLMSILSWVSCNDNSLSINGTVDNIGSQATLRVSSWENGFDLGKEDEPFVTYTFEYYDSGKLNGGEVGDFLNEIRFFISFRNYNGTIDRDEILLENIAVSEMVKSEETGNLYHTLRLTLESALQLLDLDPDAVGVNDRFTIDWEIKLQDGTNLNPKCPDWPVGLNRVPCEVFISLSHSLSEETFTGRYRFEQ